MGVLEHPQTFLHFLSSRAAFLVFSKANLQTNSILTNSKQNIFLLNHFHLQDPSTVRKQNELPLHCVWNCGGRQSLNNRLISTIAPIFAVRAMACSDYNSNIKLFSVLIDNSHYRLIFYGKKKYIPGKSILKWVELQSLVRLRNVVKCGNYIALQSSQILYTCKDFPSFT
jgi:hypothetical protein